MERAAFELSRNLAKLTEIKLIKWGGSNKWLPFVLPYLVLRGIWSLFTSDIQAIYLQDGLLAPLGVILKLFTRKPVFITLHGRDITYDNALYQSVIPKCLRRLDRVICVSEATKVQSTNRRIDLKKVSIIPNGISDEYYRGDEKNKLKKQLAKELALDICTEKILLSVGRLVERKGIHWFIERVLPLLNDNKDDYIYLVTGNGAFFGIIEDIIRKVGLSQNVLMLGQVEEKTLKLIYNASDVFIMPNIPVRGDMEGFGLVALEAASCGLPVIASDFEGIKDAICDGENGFLVEPGNPQAFVNKINELLGDDNMRRDFGEKAREYTLENYGWDKTAREYVKEFNNLTKNSQVRK